MKQKQRLKISTKADKYYDELYQKYKIQNAYEQSLLYCSTHIADGMAF